MQLFDVNVLVYAYRPDAPDHQAYRTWLTELVQGPGAFGVSELALSGFLRVVTHPRTFDPPSPFDDALKLVTQLLERPNAVRLAPGERHWAIFTELCRKTKARGNHVPDAYHAALAIEHGCEFVTADRGFARYPGLRWRHPLE